MERCVFFRDAASVLNFAQVMDQRVHSLRKIRRLPCLTKKFAPFQGAEKGSRNGR